TGPREAVLPWPRNYLRRFQSIGNLRAGPMNRIWPYRVDALILISTPAGRLSLLSASIVLAVAWTMSIKRLCVLISNCWRAFLSMLGPESTVYRSIRVGSGIGPWTSLWVRLAVSTISWAL